MNPVYEVRSGNISSVISKIRVASAKSDVTRHPKEKAAGKCANSVLRKDKIARAFARKTANTCNVLT
jgi:hypothetical protein